MLSSRRAARQRTKPGSTKHRPGTSELIRKVFGPEIGDHTRTAIGVGALPWNVPVETEAEVELA